MLHFDKLFAAALIFMEQQVLPILPLGKKIQGYALLGLAGYKAEALSDTLYRNLINQPFIKSINLLTPNKEIDIDMLEAVISRVLDGIGGKYTVNVAELSSLPQIQNMVFLDGVVFDKHAIKNIIKIAKEIQ